jgi:hypothetical protein
MARCDTWEDHLARAREALSALAQLDLDRLSGDELTEVLMATQRLRGALDVAEARALARWDAQRAWQPSGAKTAAAWLTWQQHLPAQVARQRVRHARAVRDLPAVEAAWAAGEIDRSHVTTLLNVRTPRTEERFERDHKELLDTARTTWFSVFKRHCDYWALAVDPDGAEQGAADDLAARELHLSQSFRGLWFGRLTLDPISGEIVHGALAAIERELFDQEWAEAKERLGHQPTIFDLARTPAQRRADALIEMAARARTAPRDGRRPAPLFSVLVGYETFAGPVLELANRTVLTPGTLVPWLTQADVERIVFDGPSRVIDVGAHRRCYDGADRRAIVVRDRVCFHETCDEVPDRPEIDHELEASKGGPTTLANGRLGCRFHNAWRNHHPDTDPDPPPP